MPAPISPPMLPLCVDLDGTLVRTDTLLELLLVLLKKNPLVVFAVPVWLWRGVPYFKHQVATRSSIAVDTLPYHKELLSYLTQEHKRGRQLYLTTASSEIFARKVAHHLGLFSDVIASNSERNYKGRHKAELLINRFGRKQFAYAGNAVVDVPIWHEAAAAVVVTTQKGLVTLATRHTPLERAFVEMPPTWQEWLRAVRAYQWVKNLLLFLPLIAAHRVDELPLLIAAAIAFTSFSLTASAVYILNDLFDLESDRKHPTKKNRSFAIGRIPLLWGILLIPLLGLAAFLLAWLLPFSFTQLLIGYLLLTFGYSLYLKRLVLIDVIILALFYVIRIFAGGAAVDIEVSSWLFVFALFLFLSLAMVKRYTELLRLKELQGSTASGRGYHVTDLEPISQLGVASGYLAVLVLALYISSREISALYHTPEWLWLLIPLAAYWIGRVWLLAHRGQLSGDPVTTALTDRMSYIVAAFCLGVLIIATLP